MKRSKNYFVLLQDLEGVWYRPRERFRHEDDAHQYLKSWPHHAAIGKSIRSPGWATEALVWFKGLGPTGEAWLALRKHQQWTDWDQPAPAVYWREVARRARSNREHAAIIRGARPWPGGSVE